MMDSWENAQEAGHDVLYAIPVPPPSWVVAGPRSILFAQGQRREGTVLRVLHGALQCECPGTAGQLFLLVAVQVETDDGAVGHHGGRNYTCGLSGSKERKPALHDAIQGINTCKEHREALLLTRRLPISTL